MRKVIVQQSLKAAKAEGSPDLVNFPDLDGPCYLPRCSLVSLALWSVGLLSVTAESTYCRICCNAYRLLYNLVTGIVP